MGLYHFVVEGNKLVHISHYGSEKRFNLYICYEIFVNEIKGKKIIRVASTRETGLAEYATVLLAEDTGALREYERVPLVKIIDSYEPIYLEGSVERFIVEWGSFFRPMICEVREWIQRNGVKVKASNILMFHLVHNPRYPVSLLLPYSSTARERSYRNIAKAVYRLWILVKVLKRLSITFRQLDLTQHPIVVVKNHALWLGTKVYEYVDDVTLNTVKLVPGIIVTDSSISDYGKLVEAINRGELVAELVIVLRVSPIYDARKVKRVIEMYKEVLKPKHIALALPYTISRSVEDELRNLDVNIVTEAYPGGEGEEKLTQLVINTLS
jgi:hypothetical protein